MHFTLLVLVNALLASEAVAAPTTKSLVSCITKNGPKPVATVKTTSRILTVPLYGFKVTTTTPTRYITPRPTTTTITSTQTSVATENLVQETDTFSITITSTDTIISTSTTLFSVTNTDTVTATIFPGTTTIPAPEGFQPVKSTFPDSAKRRSFRLPFRLPKPRSTKKAPSALAQSQSRIFFADGKVQAVPAVYPTAVTCAGIVQVITTSTVTRAARTKTVTASKPTATLTRTATTTSTTTLTPVRAATTLSFSATTAVTETQIESVTTTFVATQTEETAAPATATEYAICAPDNIIGSVNGAGIKQTWFTGGQSFQVLETESPYDCCVACARTADCGGTVFYSGRCVLEMQPQGSCSVDAVGFSVEPDVAVPTGDAYISNGLCARHVLSS